MSNSLQAILESKKTEPEKPKKAPVKAAKKTLEKSKATATRKDTVLIGGHFSKGVSKQLRFLAIEEETTNQELLAEALDLLFIKKGKSKIEDL